MTSRRLSPRGARSAGPRTSCSAAPPARASGAFVAAAHADGPRASRRRRADRRRPHAGAAVSRRGRVATLGGRGQPTRRASRAAASGRAQDRGGRQDRIKAWRHRRRGPRERCSSASTGTSGRWSSRNGHPHMRRPSTSFGRAGWSSPASARAPTSPSHSPLRTAMRRLHTRAPAARFPTIPSVVRPRRTAGGWIRRRRWNWRACPHGGRAAAPASRRTSTTSAMRSSPARTRPLPTISPASSTMRRAA